MMIASLFRAGALATVCIAWADGAAAQGDPTLRAERLEPLVLDAAKGFSWTEMTLSSGTYYRWRIESDGREEYKLVAPELFAQSWIDQVVVDDREVKPLGLYAIEFDAEGSIDVWFIPIRPGRYEFSIVGLETAGFVGAFVVK